MNKATNKLIPELRFPEFVNDGEWEKATLAELSEVITKGTTPTTLGFNYVDKGVNFIKIESIEDGRINLSKAAFISDECNEALKRSQLRGNDILFSIAGALGVIAPVSERELPANTNQALSIIRLKKEYNKDYIIKFLLSPEITSEIYKLKAGAAQLNISLSQVGNFRILLPKNPPEQQKIASCLSSLDEVITAHSQKLETLKDHKKGLMQNLFPQEGETVPKWRFPEFLKDREWNENQLDKLGETISGLSGKSGEDFGTGKPYVTYKQVFDNAFIDFYKCGKVNIYEDENQNSLQKGDILFTTSSETPNEVGFASVLLESPKELTYLNSFCFALRPYNLDCLKPEFSRFLFHSPIYRKSISVLAQGSTRYNISKGAFLNLKLPIPKPKEQQKIASCLSSLDALIMAQTEKIEQLKLHKKGLMQGLFPKINS